MTSNNCGIYKITNTVTGDFYIGSSMNIRARCHHHRWHLANNLHHNLHLQNSWNKHGEQAFVFETILLCDAENRLYHEQVFLDTLKPAYNIAICARAPQVGLPVSEETRRKLSEIMKVKMKGHKNHLGYKNSEESIRKMSEAQKGRVFSEKSIRKMSEAQKKRYEQTRISPSEEHARRINAARRLRKMSEEITKWYAERKANV